MATDVSNKEAPFRLSLPPSGATSSDADCANGGAGAGRTRRFLRDLPLLSRAAHAQACVTRLSHHFSRLASQFAGRGADTSGRILPARQDGREGETGGVAGRKHVMTNRKRATAEER